MEVGQLSKSHEKEAQDQILLETCLKSPNNTKTKHKLLTYPGTPILPPHVSLGDTFKSQQKQSLPCPADQRRCHLEIQTEGGWGYRRRCQRSPGGKKQKQHTDGALTLPSTDQMPS